MNVPAPTDPCAALWADAPAPFVVAPTGPAVQPIFPPKDADAETRRR